MKKTPLVGLGGAALLALFALALIQFASCGSRPGSPVRIVVPISWPKDTSSAGSGTGFHPRAIFINPDGLSAGSTLVVTCASKDCIGNGEAAGSGTAGSGAAPGSPTILFEFKIPNDLPANTEMSLSFRSATSPK